MNEDIIAIKCEDCGLVYDNENSDDDVDSIDETGKCISCNNILEVKII